MRDDTPPPLPMAIISATEISQVEVSSHSFSFGTPTSPFPARLGLDSMTHLLHSLAISRRPKPDQTRDPREPTPTMARIRG